SPAQRGHCRMQIRFTPHDAERPDGESAFRKPRFLQDLILDDPDRLYAGAKRRYLGYCAQSVDADLLYLERYRIGARREPPRRTHVIPAAHDGFIHHITGGTGWLGVHHSHPVSHRARGHRRHAPQLATAKNRNESAWTNDL